MPWNAAYHLAADDRAVDVADRSVGGPRHAQDENRSGSHAITVAALIVRHRDGLRSDGRKGRHRVTVSRSAQS